MGNGNDGPLVPLQVMFQPGDRFGVEVVGRLIQQQDIRLLQKQPAQGDAALLPPRQHLHLRIAGRTPQRIHRHFQPRIEIPRIQRVQLFLDHRLPIAQFRHLVVGHRLGEFLVDAVELVDKIHRLLHSLLDDFAHRLVLVQLGFLLQKTDSVAGRENGFAHEILIDARQNTQQRTFPRSVKPQHANFGAIEIRKIDILQNRLLVVELADADHGINDFIPFVCHIHTS